MSRLGCCIYCGRVAPIAGARRAAQLGAVIFCDPICERAVTSGLAALLTLELMVAE